MVVPVDEQPGPGEEPRPQAPASRPAPASQAAGPPPEPAEGTQVCDGGDGPASGTDPGAGCGGEPRPLGVAITPTGNTAVDAGLRRLADADHLPVSEHLTVYEDVHRRLRETLGALDRRPGPDSPAPHDTGS